jgi:hypothetical protein
VPDRSAQELLSTLSYGRISAFNEAAGVAGSSQVP